MLTFEALILGNESGGAFVEVPCDVEQVFGSKRPKVIAKFNDQISYRGSLVRMKTIHHILLIKKDIRAQLNLDVGDNIQVSIQLDETPRTIDTPEILMQAFKKQNRAHTFFNTLSYSCKREYVNYILEAKKEITRINRVEKVIELLNQGKKKLR